MANEETVSLIIPRIMARIPQSARFWTSRLQGLFTGSDVAERVGRGRGNRIISEDRWKRAAADRLCGSGHVEIWGEEWSGCLEEERMRVKGYVAAAAI